MAFIDPMERRAQQRRAFTEAGSNLARKKQNISQQIEAAIRAKSKGDGVLAGKLPALLHYLTEVDQEIAAHDAALTEFDNRPIGD